MISTVTASLCLVGLCLVLDSHPVSARAVGGSQAERLLVEPNLAQPLLRLAHLVLEVKNYIHKEIKDVTDLRD